MRIFIFLLVASAAFAQHPDSLPLTRYSEPTFPGTKKYFQHVRLGNQVHDTTTYTWNAFGKIAETEETSLPIYGYQLNWNRATAMFYFTLTDSAMRYYSNFKETEDSDAISEILLPIAKDSSWQYKLIDSVKMGITGADETVTVPAGTFNHCIVTAVKEGDELITKTYAPDVGMIKMSTVGPEFSKLVDLVSVKKP